MAIKVKKAILPGNSIIRSALQEIHYKDCYEITFKSKHRITVDDIFIAFFQSAPKWLEKLMTFRNRIVGLFGLKAAAPDKNELENFKVEVGNGIGLF